MGIFTAGRIFRCTALAELFALACSWNLGKLNFSLAVTDPQYKQQWGPPQGNCDLVADVVLIIDESSSIKPKHFQQLKVFISQFLNSLPISPLAVHASLIMFGDTERVPWDLQSSTAADPVKAQRAVMELTQLGGNTDTGKALLRAYKMLSDPGSGGRQGVPQAVVLVTDGVPNSPGLAESAAAKLRNSGVLVVVVCVGEYLGSRGKQLYATIAGCDDVGKNCGRFIYTAWENLAYNLRQVVETVCKSLPRNAQCSPWSDWSACSATCGEGFQTSYRQEVSPAIQGTPPCPRCEAPEGRSCRDNGGLMKTRRCLVTPCPPDNECGNWGTWSDWSRTCGGVGVRSRQRENYNGPSAVEGGIRCEPPKHLLDTESQVFPPCPQGCEYGEWSPCENCKKGFGTRSRSILWNDGSEASCEDESELSESCNCDGDAGDGMVDGGDFHANPDENNTGGNGNGPQHPKPQGPEPEGEEKGSSAAFVALISGGIIGVVVLVAAGAGCYYYKGARKGASGGSVQSFVESTTGGKDEEAEREALVSIDHQSGMWLPG